MSHLVDLHIIHYREPQWMLDRCIASLDGQPVNIHLIKGEKEWQPINGRKKGFSTGTAMYQSLMDPDDIVKPGAYENLLEHTGADLIYGKEELISRDGKTIEISPFIHHAYLLKRDSFSLNEKLVCFKTYSAAEERALDIVFIDKVLYEWHEKANGIKGE